MQRHTSSKADDSSSNSRPNWLDTKLWNWIICTEIWSKLIYSILRIRFVGIREIYLYLIYLPNNKSFPENHINLRFVYSKFNLLLTE